MKTVRQISNARNKAARRAHDIAAQNQKDYFAASRTDLGAERGDAMNAASFASAALSRLENGSYTEFLTYMCLAGNFADKAREAASRRGAR